MESVCLGYKPHSLCSLRGLLRYFEIVYLKLTRLKERKGNSNKLKDDASHDIFSPPLELRNRIIAAKVYPTPQGTLQENVTISFGRDKVCSHIEKTNMKNVLFML